MGKLALTFHSHLSSFGPYRRRKSELLCVRVIQRLKEETAGGNGGLVGVGVKVEVAEVVVEVGVDNRHDLTKPSSLFEELSRRTKKKKRKKHLELFQFCLFLLVCLTVCGRCLSVSVCLCLSLCLCLGLSVSVSVFLSSTLCLSRSVCLCLSLCLCISLWPAKILPDPFLEREGRDRDT